MFLSTFSPHSIPINIAKNRRGGKCPAFVIGLFDSLRIISFISLWFALIKQSFVKPDGDGNLCQYLILNQQISQPVLNLLKIFRGAGRNTPSFILSPISPHNQGRMREGADG